MTVQIPPYFRIRITETFGIQGEQWISQLPLQIATYLEKWKLKPDGAFGNLSFNFVLPVIQEDGQPAVLKFGVHPIGRAREIEALRFYDGNGAVRVLDASVNEGVVLLARAVPGQELKELWLTGREDEANEIACNVIRALISSSAPFNKKKFKSISEWGKGFDAILNAAPDEVKPHSNLLNQAREQFGTLVSTQVSEVILHADLHHSNILSSGNNSWCAIDPKGMLGDPAFEVGAFIRNPMPELLEKKDLSKLLTNRIHKLSANLEMDHVRVWGWSFAQAALAAVWAYEDKSSDWSKWMQVATTIHGLRIR